MTIFPIVIAWKTNNKSLLKIKDNLIELRKFS
ncbi:protein of unknown function [Citrobacter freundii]|nr:protein of unknown function [Citrobacter freundii]